MRVFPRAAWKPVFLLLEACLLWEAPGFMRGEWVFDIAGSWAGSWGDRWKTYVVGETAAPASHPSSQWPGVEFTFVMGKTFLLFFFFFKFPWLSINQREEEKQVSQPPGLTEKHSVKPARSQNTPRPVLCYELSGSRGWCLFFFPTVAINHLLIKKHQSWWKGM